MVMLEKYLKPDTRAVARLHWRFWGLVGLVAIACPLVYNWQQHRESVLKNEYDQLAAASESRMRAQLARVYASQDAHVARIDALYNWSRGINSRLVRVVVESAVSSLPQPPKPTRQELEDHLNEGNTFQMQRIFRDWCCPLCGPGPLPYDMVVYTPPEGGTPFYLYFDGDQFIHAEDPDLPAFKPLWEVQACDFVNEKWRTWGPRVWTFMLVLPFVLRRLRVWLAEFLVAVAILLVVPALPTSFGPWYSLGRNVEVAWGMFMTSTSVAVLIWALLRQSNSCRILCSLCGYNLRGNTSGCCPECGTAIPQDIASALHEASAAPLSPLG
jgi:hypothetical protein